MLPDLFSLLLLIFILCIQYFDYYMMEGISFLVQSIWSSIGFFSIHGISFYRLGKFSSIILLKIFTGPLNWEFSLSYIYYLQSSSFHCVLDFLHVLGQELFAICIFFECCINVFYDIFCTCDSLFYLLYSVGDACIYDSGPLSQVFYLQICFPW